MSPFSFLFTARKERQQLTAQGSNVLLLTAAEAQARTRSHHQPPGLTARNELLKQRARTASATPGPLWGEGFTLASHHRAGWRCIPSHPIGTIPLDLHRTPEIPSPKHSPPQDAPSGHADQLEGPAAAQASQPRARTGSMRRSEEALEERCS